MFLPPQDTVDVIAGVDSVFIALDTHLLPAKTHLEWPVPPLEFFNLDSALAHREALADTTAHVSPYLRPSLLNEETYKATTPDPVISPYNPSARSFTGGILFAVFICIVILRQVASRKSQVYLQAVFSRKSFFKFMEEEEPSWLPPMPILMGAASLLAGSAIAAVVLRPSDFSSPFMYFLTASGAVLVAYLFPVLRAAGLRLLGNILNISNYSRLHIQFSYLSQLLFALLMLPVFLSLALGLDVPSGWYGTAVAGAFGLVFIFHFFRLLWQFRSSGWFSVLNFFLYFCTLEIAPLFFFYKWYRLTTG